MVRQTVVHLCHEYNSTTNRNKLLIHSNLDRSQGLVMSEKHPFQKVTYCMISFNILKMIKTVQIENRSVVARVWGKGVVK